MNVTISNDTVIIGSYEYYYYDDCISYYNGYSRMMMEHQNNNVPPPTLSPDPDNGNRERFCRPLPEKVTPLSDTKQTDTMLITNYSFSTVHYCILNCYIVLWFIEQKDQTLRSYKRILLMFSCIRYYKSLVLILW